MTAPTITVDRTSQRFDGNPQPRPELLLLHTTEGSSWPPYAGGNEAPHVTVQPIPGKGIHVREHRPWTDYAKALANREGGVETNRRGVLQVELMGTCDPSARNRLYYWPGVDDVVLEALATYLRPTLDRFDIPPVAVAPFLPYPKSYGSKGGQRLTFAQWNKARGICGHQHAPENDHGDPGAFPVDRFITHLEGDIVTPQDRKDIAAEVMRTPIGKDINGVERDLGWAVGAILRDGQRQNAAIAAIKAADPTDIAAAVVAGLPGSGLTADAVAKAIVAQLLEQTQGGTQ